MDVIEGLSASYLTNHLSEDEVKAVAELAKVESHVGGDVLMRQFDKNNDLIVVLEGKVRINSYTGEQVAEGGPGSVLGEVSLLDSKPRSATVIASGSCKIAVIQSADFWKLLKSDPILARTVLVNIGQVLCDRIRTANLHLDTIVVNKHLQSR